MQRLILPRKPIDLEACTMYADRILQAVGALESQGFSVHCQSRLPTAATTLHDFVSGKYAVRQPSDLVRLGNAIHLGELATYLVPLSKNGIPEAMRLSIELFLDGSLDHARATKALQAQSEITQKILLYGADLQPVSIPTGEGKSPDYGVTIGDLPIAIEIKRPTKISNIEKKVRKAIKQCSSSIARHHAIIVDVSDCFPTNMARSAKDPDGRSSMKQFMDEAVREARMCFEEMGKRGKADRVVLLILWGEAVIWTNPSVLPANRAVFIFHSINNNAACGLVVDQSERLVRSYLRGFEKTGGEISSSLAIP